MAANLTISFWSTWMRSYARS